MYQNIFYICDFTHAKQKVQSESIAKISIGSFFLKQIKKKIRSFFLNEQNIIFGEKQTNITSNYRKQYAYIIRYTLRYLCSCRPKTRAYIHL